MAVYIQLLKRASLNGIALCTLLALVGLWAVSARGAAEPVGKVDSLAGSVSVERGGQKAKAGVGVPVYLGDKWATQADGSLEIVFLDESRVKMASNAALEITEYLYKPESGERRGLLSMTSGKARFLVQDLQDFRDQWFRVQTQTAVVDARDSDFIVWVESAELTESYCIEDVITMFNAKLPEHRVILTANMISQVSRQNVPTPPRFATVTEQRELFKGGERIGDRSNSVTDGFGRRGGEEKPEATPGATPPASSSGRGFSNSSSTSTMTTTPGSATTTTTSPPSTSVTSTTTSTLPPAPPPPTRAR